MKVVVIDWGQAEFFLPNSKRNVLVGGRSFKAPELVYGGNHPEAIHDYACDIWSYGVMLSSIIFCDGQSNLFYATTRENLIASHARSLGTEDLAAYLCDNSCIHISKTALKLISDPLTNLSERRSLKAAFYDPNHSRLWTPEANELLDAVRTGFTFSTSLHQILQYNPRDRPTARECMKFSYFADVRNVLDEQFGLNGWEDFDAALMKLRVAFSRPIQEEHKKFFDDLVSKNRAAGTMSSMNG